MKEFVSTLLGLLLFWTVLGGVIYAVLDRGFRVREKILAAWFSCIFCSIWLIILQFEKWDLHHGLSPFLSIPIEFMSYLYLGAAVIFSTYLALKLRRWKMIGGPALCLLSLYVVSTINFNCWIVDRDFKAGLKERELVVSLVRKKSLIPNVDYNKYLINLPDEYSSLSKGGGDIFWQGDLANPDVFFYTFRGIGNASGFVYKSDGSEPKQGDFNFDIFEVKKYSPNWYWIAGN